MNIHALTDYRDRFREPRDDHDDFTGIGVEITLDEVPVKLGDRTICFVSGEAHVTGDAVESYTIDVLLCRDARTDALFRVSEQAGGFEGHIARALAAEVDKVAVEKLREATQ